RNIVQLLYCIFCFPCFLRSETINQDIPEQEARIRALEAATPNHLPEHVSIDSRSITHIALTDNIRRLLSSSTEAVDDDIYIFDLFLSNPETQKLIKAHLNSETYKTHEFIIIPGLFNTARLAEIVVKEQSSENDSEGDDDLKPTNFLTLIFRGGPVVRYHLKKLPTNDIQVLAVSVSSDSYILSFVIDNYDALANQPMTTYYSSEEPLFFVEPCHCRGACNCANSRNNHTDESDYQNDNMNENMSDSITDSVFFTLEQSK
uniref:hypothetical protein n=1 Tax=Endozoicomonas sp. SESOKO2 TaxID=2828743 RepID=UPI0021494D66